MATFVYASECYCQSCKRLFRLDNAEISTVINLDIEGFEKRRFSDMSLNRIKCNKCGAEFAFETQMVIFSISRRFAIYVNPGGKPDECSCMPAPRFVFPSDFAFREVNFLIEAIEKVNIFRDGLSDVEIEKFKLSVFDKDELSIPDECNIIYTSETGGRYTFTKYDCNDNEIDSYSFDNVSDMKTECSDYNNYTYWLKINRFTINKLCRGELL